MHGIGIFILDDEAKPIAVLGVNLYGAPVLGLHGQNGIAALAAGSSALIPYPQSPVLMLKNTTSQALLTVKRQEARLNLTSPPSSNKETEIDLRTTDVFGAHLSLTFTDHSSEIENTLSLGAFPGFPSLHLYSGKEISPPGGKNYQKKKQKKK